MTYSQKPLIKELVSGRIPGETEAPKHIETVISNVFLFGKRVYKLYKNDSKFFNEKFRDISGREERFDFTKKDFERNHALSPNIYTRIAGVKLGERGVEFNVAEDAADDLVIGMNRMDSKNILFERLMSNDLTEEDCFQMGRQLAESLTRIRQSKPKGHDYFELFKERIIDTREWIRSIAESIPAEETGRWCDYMEEFRIGHESEFKGQLSNEIEFGGDIHSHNAVYADGTLNLIDTYPPKEEWLIEHELVPLYRVATDIWALSGNKGWFEATLRGYEKARGRAIDRAFDSINIVYAASIMVSYLFMLQRSDPAKKIAANRYLAFMREYFGML